MKYKLEVDTTSSSSVYRRAIKRYYDNTGKINCSYCHYHHGDNGHRLQRNWKKFRHTQYKIKE